MGNDATIFLSGYSGLVNSDIAAFLGRTFSSQENTLATSLITAVEDFIARNCKRQFKQNDGAATPADIIYQETFDGGEMEYFTHSFPLKEVTKITLDGVTQYEKGGSSNVYTLGTDFFVYPDRVIFNGIVPASSVNNMQALVIEYSIKLFWGEDVKLAVKRWVAEIMSQREYGGKTVTRASTGGGLSLDFNSKDIPDYVQEVVKRYKKYQV